LVNVHATALNRADLLQRMGRYPPPPGTRADIPGLEFAGEVSAIGKEVTKFKIGDRIMGLLAGAGYAEKVVTHQDLALPIPANLDYPQAAAIPEVFLTAYDALFNRLQLKTAESVLIHAVGSGVGSAALQLAKSQQAIVFGTAGSEIKLAKARELGLDFGIHYPTQNFEEIVLSETGGRGVAAILDVVGAAYWEKNLACLATKGKLVIVGLLSGGSVPVDLRTLMTKRLQIIGTVLRARPLAEKIQLSQKFQQSFLPLFESGQLTPVVDRRFPLREAAEAHRYLETNQNFGKVVLEVS
ncbi:MAG: NAD(P)H-quinone oxidoreductase, partial [bacterium]